MHHKGESQRVNSRAIPRGLSALVLVVLLAQPAFAASVSNGERLFAVNCAMCHGDGGTGMMGMHPALLGVADRLSEEEIRAVIMNGRNTIPPMPAWKKLLSREQIEDIIAYLGTLEGNFTSSREAWGMGSAMGMMGGMMGGADQEQDTSRISGSPSRLEVYGALAASLLFLLSLLALGIALYAVSKIKGADKEAIGILKTRYAKGELTEEEFLKVKKALEMK